jgi:hypothetical protein
MWSRQVLSVFCAIQFKGEKAKAKAKSKKKEVTPL